LLDKSQTLALIDEPAERKEAKTLLQQAWDLQQHQDIQDNQDINFKFNILINFVALHIDEQEFNQANQWLEQGKDILKQDKNQQLLHPRTSLLINYHEAQIYLHTGIYETAKELYHTALNQAEEIHWERAITYIQDWLAQVAIQQGELKEAQNWLEKSLLTAQHYGDSRCIAFCQRSYALLEKARGNLEASTHWATLAKKSFTQLGMRQKAAEMQKLIVNIMSC
jgi:LuxR family glucitol operon transcriptional activator